MSKIHNAHLERTAYVYVRQSTMTQVQHNVESQRRQYALVECAQEHGWANVRVIDDDLGCSGCGHVERQGFETLMADVCQGQVGAIFAIEASRLARNGQEWHRLLEFCAIVGTLIVDYDRVYDPRHPDDRLMLGIKGTMSELEISTFRQRSQEAIRQKARRGEYYTRIPEGYIQRDDGSLEKDSDEQVRRALELVFAKFHELGSARQVSLWLRQEAIHLPRRTSPKANQIEFVPAMPWLITRILKDPTYAGAYAFGRTKRQVVLENQCKRVVKQKRARPEDWEVLIHDHHESYLCWQEYLKNQETLAHNRNQLGGTVRGAARCGKALLAGLVRCGRCGRKMRVHYGGRRPGRRSTVYYLCFAPQREEIGKQICSLCGGVTVEQGIVDAVLHALSPTAMEAVARTAAALATKQTEKHQQLEFALERARYEADRCQRQYQAAEPENRLVARTLETRWNDALQKVEQLEKDLEESETPHKPLSCAAQATLHTLAADLPRLWNHTAVSPDLKKRLIRTVIKEIVLYVEKKTIRILIHWQGGQHTELSLRKRKTGEHRWKTEERTLELIRQLARLLSDKQIAAQLNRMNIRTSKGHAWTRTRVGNFRTVNDILNYTPGERQARREMTIEEVAQKLGVSYSTVQRMIQRKQLPARQVCAGAPWIIRSADVATRTPSSLSPDSQALLFSEDI